MSELISIITPAYNAEKYICETIKNVQAQSYENWEWLIVEDGPTDDTDKVISEYLKEHPDPRIRVIRKENEGAALTRNRGLEEASGRYVTYLDADDLWHPEKLEKELAFLREKQAGFVFTGYEFADEEGHGLGKVVKVPATLSYRQALCNTTIFTSTVMFDTQKIAKELLRMPNVPSEDSALWFQILRNGNTAYGLNENLVLYRRSAGTLSSDKKVAIKRIWNLYRRVEGLSVPYSAYNFCLWAIHAVLRRV